MSGKEERKNMQYKYKTAICAGTFDQLHEGHKVFLRFAFSVAEKVYVTITSDVYTAAHKPYTASYKERSKNVEEFLINEGVFKRAIVLPIDDIYGITLDQSLPIEALIVTPETLSGAKRVNDKRMAYGLPPLALELAPLMQGEAGIKISSSHVHTGITDTKGKIVIKDIRMQTNLLLPTSLRERLQKPFGKIVSPQILAQSADSTKLIAVGDVTSKKLHQAGLHQILSVVDFVIERKVQKKSLEMLGFVDTVRKIFAENPPAMITPSLWRAIKEGLAVIDENKEVVIVVEGEEDLAVLPLLLLAPVGYTLCYGQPHEGMVAVIITEKVKEEIIHILSEFKKASTRGY